jgi:hypothetical protein
LIEITNNQGIVVGLFDPANAISKFIFHSIHEVEGGTQLILSKPDMGEFQAIENLELGEVRPITRIVPRENPFHNYAIIRSIQNLSPNVITVSERDGLFEVEGTTPGNALIKIIFETGECHRIAIVVSSQQIPGLSSSHCWPIEGQITLPKGYHPSPIECFEKCDDSGEEVVWSMNDYVHDVNIRKNGVIIARVPAVLKNMNTISTNEIDFSNEPYTSIKDIYVDTIAVLLPALLVWRNGAELSWFTAEENGIERTSFTPEEAGHRTFVLKIKDYLGIYRDARLRHPSANAHNNLLLTYNTLSWDLESKLKDHLRIEDGRDGNGVFKHISIDSEIMDDIPSRYRSVLWNAEPEEFYECKIEQNQLLDGMLEFKVYRNYQAPAYDTILSLIAEGSESIDIPLSFDSSLDLEPEMLTDSSLHLFCVNGWFASMRLELPSLVEELPRYDWRAKLSLDGDFPPVDMEISIEKTGNSFSNLSGLPSNAHLVVSHPYQRPIREQIEIVSHDSDWNWLDGPYLDHKLVRYCKKFQQRMKLKASGYLPMKSELYQIDGITTYNPFGYSTTLEVEYRLAGESVSVKDYDFIMQFCPERNGGPKIVRLVTTEVLDETLELEGSSVFGISMGWQNDGEAWENQQHFEKENTSLIFSLSELPEDNTLVIDGMFELSTPGVYLFLSKSGSPNWYCNRPDHIGRDEWPDGFIGFYAPVLEIEVF